jgi:nucleoid-associated protein YgaU
MDLFGFAKDVGRRLFNKDEDAAEKIKEHIEQFNPGVENLEVKFERGIVELCGECVSSEAREKAILMAGNTKGVIDVYASDLSVKQTAQTKAAAATKASTGKDAPVEAKVEYYVVESGDTLGKIAKRYYGNAMAYPKIFEANREIIHDPDKIFVGQKIRIPID